MVTCAPWATPMFNCLTPMFTCCVEGVTRPPPPVYRLMAFKVWDTKVLLGLANRDLLKKNLTQLPGLSSSISLKISYKICVRVRAPSPPHQRTVQEDN